MARAEHDILKCSSIHGQLQQLQCCVPLQCVLLLKLQAQRRCPARVRRVFISAQWVKGLEACA